MWQRQQSPAHSKDLVTIEFEFEFFDESVLVFREFAEKIATNRHYFLTRHPLSPDIFLCIAGSATDLLNPSGALQMRHNVKITLNF
jgi:hypothetical protein